MWIVMRNKTREGECAFSCFLSGPMHKKKGYKNTYSKEHLGEKKAHMAGLAQRVKYILRKNTQDRKKALCDKRGQKKLLAEGEDMLQKNSHSGQEKKKKVLTIKEKKKTRTNKRNDGCPG